MLSFSNAKINLGLNILEKRPDGYHNIESVFYPVPWTDVLEVLPSDTFSFTTSGLDIPGTKEQNLILKAYKLLQENYPIKPLKIHLHKVLPMGAGIGGGSSNGAFALSLINEVLDLQIGTKKLEVLASELGSDCPFFIQNKPRFCYGKGIEFSETTVDLSGKFIVMVNPGIHITTQEAYAGVKPYVPKLRISEITKLPISEWRNTLSNDFEQTISKNHITIGNIKKELYENGALYASMTGSGSTLYGIWDKEVDLKSIFKQYTYWSGYLK